MHVSKLVLTDLQFQFRNEFGKLHLSDLFIIYVSRTTAVRLETSCCIKLQRIKTFNEVGKVSVT